MPELSKCIKYKNHLNCWDKSTHDFVEVIIKPIPPEQCPRCVIAAIVEGRDMEEVEA